MNLQDYITEIYTIVAVRDQGLITDEEFANRIFIVTMQRTETVAQEMKQ